MSLGQIRKLDGLTPQQRYRKRHLKKCRAAWRKWRLDNLQHYTLWKADAILRQRLGDGAPEHKAKQLKKQKGLCAICRRKLKKACQDHKGKVLRGVLCDACNRGIGCLGDSRRILRRAIAYLRKWGF